MSVMASRPVLRWAVPAGVLVVVLGGGAVTTALRASADARLAPRSAAQLLVDLQTARLDGVSGTVVERADLGLPPLPGSVGGDGSADLNSLITELAAPLDDEQLAVGDVRLRRAGLGRLQDHQD